ncbi:unnamed protein product [Lasius platythorax]|uniref:Uncharacterized protein n=1 Tax=Lasius platythorax TaxID=488582 RepID=A0AAV2MWZ2_9HYME
MIADKEVDVEEARQPPKTKRSLSVGSQTAWRPLNKAKEPIYNCVTFATDCPVTPTWHIDVIEQKSR